MAGHLGRLNMCGTEGDARVNQRGNAKDIWLQFDWTGPHEP